MRQDTQGKAMSDLHQQARDFVAARHAAEARATQMVALRLCCGMDLPVVMAAEAPVRRAALQRLERLVERERLRGHARHWSYDLNRHIALKQAADLLLGSICGEEPCGREACRACNAGHKKNGAWRRRGRNDKMESRKCRIGPKTGTGFR